MGTLLTVGKLYDPIVTSWPEGSQFGVGDGGCELLLSFDKPTPKEVTAIQSGTARFAVHYSNPVLLFAYQFGKGIPWSDANFDYWKVPEDHRTLPPRITMGTQRYLVSVVLVEAGTGIVRALRAVTLSPECSRVIESAVHSQSQSPHRGRDFTGVLQGLYAKFGTVEDMLLDPATVRCIGGQ